MRCTWPIVVLLFVCFFLSFVLLSVVISRLPAKEQEVLINFHLCLWSMLKCWFYQIIHLWILWYSSNYVCCCNNTTVYSVMLRIWKVYTAFHSMVKHPELLPFPTNPKRKSAFKSQRCVALRADFANPGVCFLNAIFSAFTHLKYWLGSLFYPL